MWTLDMIARVRRMRREGWPMEAIYEQFPRRSLREIREAWWATILRDDKEALIHLDSVLFYQANQVPLVNGRPLRFEGGRHG